MVKHTQTIRRKQPTNCLSVFDHFVGLVLKGIRSNKTVSESLNNYVKKWSKFLKKQIYVCAICYCLFNIFF